MESFEFARRRRAERDLTADLTDAARLKRAERELAHAKKLLSDIADPSSVHETVFVNTDADSILQDLGDGMLMRTSPFGDFELLEVEGSNAQSLLKW